MIFLSKFDDYCVRIQMKIHLTKYFLYTKQVIYNRVK